MPSEKEISRSLRLAVDQTYRVSPANVRPKAVCRLAEEQLGLENGFFANETSWKQRSKQILQDRFEELVDGAELEQPSAKEPKKRRSADIEDEDDIGVGRPKKSAQRSSIENHAKAGEPPKKKKTKKKALPSINGSASPKSRKKDASEQPALGEQPADEPRELLGAESSAPKLNDEGLDDSDLSSLIDDVPKPSRKKKKKASSEPKDDPGKSKPPKKSTESSTSPQDAELKELQSQLLQCGIRKIWAMHLKKFETHKEKVGELKRMLKEVGMEGRFSKDKARQIKEERELKADIQAIQDGDEKWGKREDSDKRKRAVANRIVDFGDDEESD